MKVEEIKKVLSITGRESDIFLPNEIFSDLQGYIVDSTHIALAYSYSYLIQFLYRNCKYFNTEELIDVSVIKQILGYSKSNRTMNYITKKGGLLEEIGYLESTKNFPMAWSYENNSFEALSFFMASEMDKDLLPPVPKMFFLKCPLKAFKRVVWHKKADGGIEEKEMEGTFYDVSNTHSVGFDVFMYCMANKDLGVVGFYLYSWLKHKNDLFDGYDVPLSNLSAETGIARRTLIKYMDFLKGYNMIEHQFNQEYFVVGMFDKDRKATTYYTNSYSSFLDKPVPFEKMEVMKREEYLAIKKLEREEFEKSIPSVPMADIDIAQLPY